MTPTLQTVSWQQHLGPKADSGRDHILSDVGNDTRESPAMTLCGRLVPRATKFRHPIEERTETDVRRALNTCRLCLRKMEVGK